MVAARSLHVRFVHNVLFRFGIRWLNNGKNVRAIGRYSCDIYPDQCRLGDRGRHEAIPSGIFCDGINKILVPTRPARTAVVVVTGPATSLRDTTNVPTSELCEYLARTPAPIDFGRSAVEFLTSQNMPLAQLSGTGLTDKIYHDILPYLQAGNLRDFEGTRLAQIIISEFDPDAKISSVRSLGVDLASASEFRLQPLRVTAFTTVHGDTFQLQSDRALLPFGEVEYFHEQVLSGPGKAFLSDDYSEFVKGRR